MAKQTEAQKKMASSSATPYVPKKSRTPEEERAYIKSMQAKAKKK